VVIYLRQSGKSDVPTDTPETPAAQLAQPRPQQPNAQQRPRQPELTYEQLRQRHELQASGFFYRIGDHGYILAHPAVPAQPPQRPTPIYGRLYDVQDRLEGVQAKDFYRRSLGQNMAFEDTFPPLGLPSETAKPQFKSAAEIQTAPEGAAPPVLESDAVVGLRIGDKAKAFPKKFLYFHDVINDELGGTPFVLVCNSAAGAMNAFDRRVEGEELHFGSAGLYYQASTVLYDVSTRSLWSGLTGQALTHKMLGKQLKPVVPLVETQWSAWKAQYPDTLVMTATTWEKPQQFRYGPNYAVGDGYDEYPRTFFPVRGYEPDGKTGEKTPVYGVRTEDGAKAYTRQYLEKAGTLEDVVGKTQVVVTYDPALGDAKARTADGKPLLCQRMYWFAWAGNYPGSELKSIERMPSPLGQGEQDPLGWGSFGTPLEKVQKPEGAPPAGTPKAPAPGPTDEEKN